MLVDAQVVDAMRMHARETGGNSVVEPVHWEGCPVSWDSHGAEFPRYDEAPPSPPPMGRRRSRWQKRVMIAALDC